MTGCILAIFSILVPRLVILFIAILTNWFSLTYETVIWPVVGWFFAPFTTLVYMAAIFDNGHITVGWGLVLIGALFFDFAKNISAVKGD